MQNFGKLLGVAAVCAAFLIPASAFAVGAFLPFGGRIITSVPCVSPEGPAFWVTIVPFGIPGTIPPVFIWTPFTLSSTLPPLASIPPTHTLEQIAGTYVPGVFEVCTVGAATFTGLRMLTENNSLPSGGF